MCGRRDVEHLVFFNESEPRVSNGVLKFWPIEKVTLYKGNVGRNGDLFLLLVNIELKLDW